MKDILRLLYFWFRRYFVERRFSAIKIDNSYTLRNISHPNHRHSFYGYYTNNPFDSQGNRVLICSTDHNEIRANLDVLLYLYVLDLGENSFRFVDKTNAWNWQQGTMFQWIDDDRVIYNKFDKENDKYYSCIFNLTDGNKEHFPRPIYQVKPFSNFGLSLSFKKLAKYRPDYGYFCHSNTDDINDEGIYLLNFKNGKTINLISIDRILEYGIDKSFKGLINKLNHIDISPDGEKFLFLHRWFVKGKKNTRLLVYNIAKDKLKEIGSRGFISHNCWLDNKTIISFCENDKGVQGYYKIDIDSGAMKPFLSKIKFDGHPKVVGDNLITDRSNSSKSRIKELFSYNLKTEELNTIAYFSIGGDNLFGEKRIDLHPKLSDNGVISIDYYLDGKRRMGILTKR